jgi:hypothetical protein
VGYRVQQTKRLHEEVRRKAGTESCIATALRLLRLPVLANPSVPALDAVLQQYSYTMASMEANCGYSDSNIPQLEDIRQFLSGCTGMLRR